ncbi:DMT family transporter [Lactococcus lactis]|uniref:DMT family transporter n=1 Tax=Lactococcus lactis TaxID=1358 RepID=UPI002939115B|nr:DMT family transporter [Lactococcus lactis]WOF40803.1 DMT family transporter [Lactococcus lactis]
MEINANSNLAHQKMLQKTKTFRRQGLMNGLISGFTYGIYSLIVMIASRYNPLLTAAGFLAAPYVTSGINDFLSGLLLLIYNTKNGKLPELGRSLRTRAGKIMILGFILGGPMANGAYLVGLYLAGAYAIPISATTALFGALFAAIFLKQKVNARVVAGMIICVAGAIVINLVKPAGAPNFTLGIIMAIIAAVCWGLEGVISSFGGAMLDSEVTVNLRQLISGGIELVIIIPLVGALGLLSKTILAGMPVFLLLLSGAAAAVSFVTWYKANATVGTAVGMSLNITYAFWGVLFSILFLHQAVTATIVIGSVIIIIGAVLVTMNPLDFFKKEEN